MSHSVYKFRAMHYSRETKNSQELEQSSSNFLRSTHFPDSDAVSLHNHWSEGTFHMSLRNSLKNFPRLRRRYRAHILRTEHLRHSIFVSIRFLASYPLRSLLWKVEMFARVRGCVCSNFGSSSFNPAPPGEYFDSVETFPYICLDSLANIALY